MTGDLSVAIDRPMMDASDYEYVLAGRLLGTQWKSDRMGIDEIGSINYAFTRAEGHQVHFPEVEFEYTGRLMRVQQFKASVREGRFEPTNLLAVQVVEMLLAGRDVGNTEGER